MNIHNRILLTLATLLLFATAAFPMQFPAVEVTRVIDGDTIEVMLSGKKERVRLIGVDTPETVKPNTPVQPYGKEASDYTKQALTGKTVWLEFDATPRDRYSRMLAYVWLEMPVKQGDDGEIRAKMFNARLLLDGYAQLMTIPPNVRYVDFFKGYQAEARDGNLGLWGIESSVAQESYYVLNKNSMVFHRPNCRSAAKMSAKNREDCQSRADAIKGGYRACGSCAP